MILYYKGFFSKITKMKFYVLFFLLFFKISFAQQKNFKELINDASNSYENQDYEKTLNKIEIIKQLFKSSPPPIVSSLEILAKSEIIKKNLLNDYALLADTRILVERYLKNPNSKKDKNYSTVVSLNNILNTYPIDLPTFNAQKEAVLREVALEKERKEKAAIEKKIRLEREAKAREERDRLLREEALEKEKKDNLITERKTKLAPYSKAITISDYELGDLSEFDFTSKFDKAKVDFVKIEQEEIVTEELRVQRYNKLEQYVGHVSYYELKMLGNYTDSEFQVIYNKAKKDFKQTKKNNKTQIGSFSSLGFQSGEIAKYGLLYESGGRKAIGFRLSARTSLTPEEDILNGTVTKNKTEIELGPNIKIFKRIYLNLGAGYGYYDKIINNDYSGLVSLEKTVYSVATTGIMIRLSRVISINGGASFMDIDKDFYKPEITFGISFNLRGKYKY